MPLNEDLQRALYSLFEQAENRGHQSVEINSAELYRRTARLSPGAPHVLISSAVMRSIAKPGDEILHGAKADLVSIRYRLPRPQHQRPSQMS